MTILASCISIMEFSLSHDPQKRLTDGPVPWSSTKPMEPVLVLEKRAGLAECGHRVRAAVWKDGALARAAGDADSFTYLRSSAKPVQALACILTGAADRFAMTDAEIALACGSHGGESFHVDTAAGLLAKIGLSAELLQCGAHPPAFEPAARALATRGIEPTALHNNCSGKHSAMLAAG